MYYCCCFFWVGWMGEMFLRHVFFFFLYGTFFRFRVRFAGCMAGRCYNKLLRRFFLPFRLQAQCNRTRRKRGEEEGEEEAKCVSGLVASIPYPVWKVSLALSLCSLAEGCRRAARAHHQQAKKRKGTALEMRASLPGVLSKQTVVFFFYVIALLFRGRTPCLTRTC